MRPFNTIDGLVAPLNRANVDTDAILPKQFLKSIQRTGFGDFLFDEWRYLDHGEPGMDCSKRQLNTEFTLNEARYRGAPILLARENFGCGSSREHAVWALKEYGFRAIISSRFADIFSANCVKNGILPVTLDALVIEGLFGKILGTPGHKLKVDLTSQTVSDRDGWSTDFEIDSEKKIRLCEGLDDIDETLKYRAEIETFEVRRRALEPWLFSDPAEH